MTTSGMSKGFAKFASKTTKGSYDDARQNERIGRGIPFDVGQKGTAVVGGIICDETKEDKETGEKFPRVRVELKVETPEGSRGKALSGSGLMQTIKDGKDPSKWSAEQAWGAMLGLLEDLGLPEEISKGYSEFQECIDWFEEESRKVVWEIQANDYTNNQGVLVKGKQIRAYTLVNESELASAEGTPLADDPNASYCTYLGSKHLIMEDREDTLTLKGVQSQRIRTDVPRDKCTFN